MKKRNRVLVIIGTLLALIVLGLVGYFAWMNIAYVDTLHARVIGSLVQVSFPSAGRVQDLFVEVGDTVAKNEELATLEVGGLGTGQMGVARVLLPIKAPISGTVVEVVAQVGDIRSPGQPIVTLVDLDRLWIRAHIHENKIAHVHVGQPVRIRVRLRSLKRTLYGRVEQVGGATTSALAARGSSGGISTPSLVEVPVRISIDSEGYPLYPGMSAEVRMGLSPRLW